ncbi:MAG: peptide chain release factor 1 [bacterium]|nr:peptide chain release factor 1 [bacterium]
MILEKLGKIEENYKDINARISDPATISNRAEFQRLAKMQKDLEPLVLSIQALKKIENDIKETREIIEDKTSDKEMVLMAEAELLDLEGKKAELSKEVKIMLLPKDANDEKNVIVEMRAGAGGDESALFVSELFRMYSHYAERQRWKIEILSSSPIGIGGLKDIVFNIIGKGVYSKLKYESGTHRVQRVPVTEGSGRIHTSTATVAILPEVEEVELEIKPEELKIDICRAGGAGGQHVNTTDSAVRITHLPSGLVVSCQDERSQHKNKAKGMKILRARLMEQMIEKKENERASERRTQIGTGDRSEKIRTYNFPQNRLTDHRIKVTLYKLQAIMEGDLDELIASLTAYDHDEQMKKMGEDVK